MKKNIFLMLVLFVLIAITVKAVYLSCNIRTNSCAGGEIALLYLKNETGGYNNAHAQLANYSTHYSKVLCCNNSWGTLSNTCDGIFSEQFLDLSSPTNAHVQDPDQSFSLEYNYHACIKGEGPSCEIKTSCNSSLETCLVSISNSTNAHVGDCNKYPNKVCCKDDPCKCVVSNNLAQKCHRSHLICHAQNNVTYKAGTNATFKNVTIIFDNQKLVWKVENGAILTFQDSDNNPATINDRGKVKGLGAGNCVANYTPTCPYDSCFPGIFDCGDSCYKTTCMIPKGGLGHRCVLIDCTGLEDQSSCEAVPHCLWINAGPKIIAESGSTLKVLNTYIEGTMGLEIYTNNVQIENTTFNGSRLSLLLNSSNKEYKNLDFYNNKKSIVINASKINITNSRFFNNTDIALEINKDNNILSRLYFANSTISYAININNGNYNKFRHIKIENNGGIYISNSSYGNYYNLTLKNSSSYGVVTTYSNNNIFDKLNITNTTNYAILIYTSSANNTINNSYFSNNDLVEYPRYFGIVFEDTYGYGGNKILNSRFVDDSVFTSSTYNLRIENCSFTNKTGTDAGAIWSVSDTNMTIKNNRFENLEDWALYIQSSDSRIENNVFINTPSSVMEGYGTITLNGASYINVTGNNITNNSVRAVLIESGNNCIFKQNRIVTSQADPIIFISAGSNHIFDNNTINASGTSITYFDLGNSVTTGVTIKNHNIYSKATSSTFAYLRSSASQTKIENNKLTGFNPTLYFESSQNNNITGNNISAAQQAGSIGVSIAAFSNNNIFRNNKFENAKGQAIYYISTGAVAENKYINNIFKNNNYAIYARYNSKEILENNTIYNSTTHGILIFKGYDVNVTGNLFNKTRLNSLYYASTNNSMLKNNTIINSTIGVAVTSSTSSPGGVNLKILKNNIKRTTSGVNFAGLKNGIISSNRIMDSTTGITIATGRGNNSLISENNITRNSLYGIEALGYNLTLYKNNISGPTSVGGACIRLSNSKYEKITNNIIEKCSKGISLEGRSTNNKIWHNIIKNKGQHGINLDTCPTGTYSNNNISNNTIYGSLVGITLGGNCNNNTFNKNKIYNNYYGFYVNPSITSLNLKNNFLYNNLAYDFVNYQTGTLTIGTNWWNTNSSSETDERIFDNEESGSQKGAVTFETIDLNYDDDNYNDNNDNCIFIPNNDQADSNNNGIGNACEFQYSKCQLVYNNQDVSIEPALNLTNLKIVQGSLGGASSIICINVSNTGKYRLFENQLGIGYQYNFTKSVNNTFSKNITMRFRYQEHEVTNENNLYIKRLPNENLISTIDVWNNIVSAKVDHFSSYSNTMDCGDIDLDNNSIGDLCDPDSDFDGLLNPADNCPYIQNPDQLDTDCDGIGDLCDNCPRGASGTETGCQPQVNPDQTDTDGDGQGDICDADLDNDGILNGVDNCKYVKNTDQYNSDTDSFGDACDNCPTISNSDQHDLDYDNIGDVCDDDIDSDNILNSVDACPTEWGMRPTGCFCIDEDNDGEYFIVSNPICGIYDCDDNNRRINHNAVENCVNSLDDDCDGSIDMEDRDCNNYGKGGGGGGGYNEEKKEKIEENKQETETKEKDEKEEQKEKKREQDEKDKREEISEKEQKKENQVKESKEPKGKQLPLIISLVLVAGITSLLIYFKFFSKIKTKTKLTSNNFKIKKKGKVKRLKKKSKSSLKMVFSLFFLFFLLVFSIFLVDYSLAANYEKFKLKEIYVKDKHGKNLAITNIVQTEKGYKMSFDTTDASVVIENIEEIPEKFSPKIDYEKDSRLGTKVIHIKNDLKFNKATIKLKKFSNVDHIFVCEDEDFDEINFICSRWKVTKIPFTEKNGYIEFEVEHFSNYGGGQSFVVQGVVQNSTNSNPHSSELRWVAWTENDLSEILTEDDSFATYNQNTGEYSLDLQHFRAFDGADFDIEFMIYNNVEFGTNSAILDDPALSPQDIGTTTTSSSTRPDLPQGFSVTHGDTYNKISWNVVSGLRYYIYRHTVVGTALQLVKNTTGSPVNDTGLNVNSHYCYLIIAVNNNDLSKLSSHTDEICVNTSSSNNPPTCSKPPDQLWLVNTQNLDAFDLDDYFTDPDGDSLVYNASSSDNPNINVTIDINNFVDFTQPNGWTGVETVSFTASDGRATVTCGPVYLYVLNEIPEFNDITLVYSFIVFIFTILLIRKFFMKNIKDIERK